jgi:hypothetical protein
MFDLFVNQPGHADLTEGRYFYCPLCRRGPFPREATAGETPQLTLAHIIPESLGGTWTTLACVGCNNGHGHEIEADLLAQHRFTDWVHGRGSLNVRMGDERRVRAESRRDPEANRLSFNITTPMASPTVQAHQARLRSAEAGQAFQITLPLFRPGWCWAAVSQSAYLLMFRWFGYDFARNPRYNFIRDQVFDPDGERAGHILELPPDIAAQLLDDNQAAVVFTREPMRAILAVMRFRSPGEREQVLAVAMPGPDAEPLTTVGIQDLVYSPVAEAPEVMAAQQGAFWLAWHQWLAS